MTDVKRVIAIDVNDEPFKRFAAAFQKWTEAQKEAVGDAKAVGAATAEAANAGATAVIAEEKAITKKRKTQKAAAQEKQDQQKAEEREAKKKADTESKAAASRKKDHDETVKRFKDMAKWSADVAWSTAKTTANIAKWLTFGAIGGGFGLGGLAASAAGARRTSQGLGITSGELRAANVNFGKYINPEATLENIANAQSDQSKQWLFNAIGVNQKGKDAGQLMAEMLPRMVEVFRSSGSTLQGAQAHGLTEFVGMDDLRRMSKLSREELQKTIEAYQEDRKALEVNDATNRDWQEFLVSLHRAGQTIEKYLIEGLKPLLPYLEQFAKNIGEAIKVFLSNKDLKKWIDSFGHSIEKVARYLGSDEFQSDVGKFLHAVHVMAVWLGKLFPGDGAHAAAGDVALEGLSMGETGQSNDRLAAALAGPIAERNHNPGNLRVPGSKTQFQSFGSDAAGLRAMANQLLLYEDRDKLDTIAKIIGKYAPSSENDTKGYIAHVAASSGYDATGHIDLHDPMVMSKIISAMTKQENAHSNFTPGAVKVIIENTTGGNAQASVAALNGAH